MTTVDKNTTKQNVNAVKKMARLKAVVTQSKERKLSKKERLFAEKWVETENGTQSALAVYNTKDYSTAGAIATENLKKPKIQSYIQELIEREITDEELTALHVRNARQTENYPTSQKAIESLEVIKGLVKEREKESKTINIAIITPDIQAKVKSFEEQLKSMLYGTISKKEEANE